MTFDFEKPYLNTDGIGPTKFNVVLELHEKRLLSKFYDESTNFKFINQLKFIILSKYQNDTDHFKSRWNNYRVMPEKLRVVTWKI